MKPQPTNVAIIEQIFRSIPSAIWDAIGSAIGGFVGVAGFFLLRYRLELRLSAPKVIKQYRCVTTFNMGGKDERDFELKHHRGSPLTDEHVLRRFEVDHHVWEWGRQRTDAGDGECILFGPYSHDAAEPGMYSVTFRIRGVGFIKPEDISKNWDILYLDVLRTKHQQAVTATQSGAQITTYPVQDILNRRIIRVSDLTRPGWQDYQLVFASDGGGMFEYRCWAFDGEKVKPDNIANCGKEVRILFDCVTVMTNPKVHVPWA